MKIIRWTCCAIAAFFLLVMPAKAAEMPDSKLLDTDELKNSLSGDAADFMEGAEISEELDFHSGLAAILEKNTAGLKGYLKSGLRSGCMMLAIVLLCAVVSTLGETRSIHKPILFAGVLAISAIAVSDVSGFIGLGKTVLTQMSDFSRALLPTLSSAAAFSGAFTGAAGKYAASALLMELLITVSNRLILPLLYAYVAVLIGAAATENEALSAVAKLVRWAAATVLTITVTLFVALLGLSGIVSANADAFATRFVKSAVSTALPVVGGIMADAAGTIVSAAGMLKNAVGIFGLLGVAAICAGPVLRLGLQYLIYKASAGLAGVLADKRLQALMSGVGSAFGLVLGMTGACGAMMYISIIAFMKVVSG